MQDAFLYLRTKLAIEHDDQTISELAEAFPFQAMRSVSIHEQYARDPLPVQVMPTAWANGTIIKFRSRLAPVDLATAMQEALAKFDAWAIIDLAGDFADSAAIGPISQFFSQHQTFSQICIIAKDNDVQYEKAAEGIRSTLRGVSLPVFHFRDGKIILVATKEPASITSNRCRRYLDKMSYWAIIDHTGRALSSDVDDDWIDVYLDSLSYKP
jgi:hypothetical protein